VYFLKKRKRKCEENESRDAGRGRISVDCDLFGVQRSELLVVPGSIDPLDLKVHNICDCVVTGDTRSQLRPKSRREENQRIRELTVLTTKPFPSVPNSSTAMNALTPSFLTPPLRALPKKTSFLIEIFFGVSLIHSNLG
jgi:hypothetical protein